MRTENNLDQILKKFNPQKVEETKQKGIVSFQQKKFNLKEVEAVNKPVNSFNQNMNENVGSNFNRGGQEANQGNKSNFNQTNNFQVHNQAQGQRNQNQNVNFNSNINKQAIGNNLQSSASNFPSFNSNSNLQNNNKNFNLNNQNANLNNKMNDKNNNLDSSIDSFQMLGDIDEILKHYNDDEEDNKKYTNLNKNENKKEYPNNSNFNQNIFSGGVNSNNHFQNAGNISNFNDKSSNFQSNVQAQNYSNQNNFSSINYENINKVSSNINSNNNYSSYNYNQKNYQEVNLVSSSENNTNTNNNPTTYSNVNINEFEIDEAELQQIIAESSFNNLDFGEENISNNNFNTGNNFNSNPAKPLKVSNPPGGPPVVEFIEKYCANHKVANLSEWGRAFEWDDLVEGANLRVFGYRTFRPNQREIINASLSGRDIFVCMPTGGGKSLTFQIPALVSDGVTIVVMPLLSLIVDQVSQMHGLGVNVIFLNNEVEKTMDENYQSYFLTENLEERCKMIFVTPEKIAQSNRTMNLLGRLFRDNIIDRFVIDEAHCVSQWGREFRPDYLNLRILRKNFPSIPLLAITATAPNKIREDIITQLQMRDTLFFRSSYNRTNLYIEVRNKKGVHDLVGEIAKWIKSSEYKEASGLIYCASRKDCENLSEKLRKDHGLSVHYYHASMPEKQKNSVQEKWKNDEIKIICATIAFGMGINKADVRYVIHYAMPKSFENYYQEIGRAGRDGKRSHCILYYNQADRKTQEYLMFKSGLQQNQIIQNLRKVTEIIEYCEEVCECRRVIALLYFDERFDRNNCERMCDNCNTNKYLKEERIVTAESVKILQFLRNCWNSKIDYTTSQAIDYLRGGTKSNKYKKVPNNDNNMGALKNSSAEELKKIVRRLIIKKYIDESLQQAGENIFAVMNISKEGFDYLSRFERKQPVEDLVITFARLMPKDGSRSEYKKVESNNLDVYSYKFSDDIQFGYNISGVKGGFSVLHAEVNKKDKKVKEKKEDLELLAKKKAEHTARIYSRVGMTGPSGNVDGTSSVNSMDIVRPPYEIVEQEVKKKNYQEEDYGYCNQEQFEELLDKLKNKRREILKTENKRLENEQQNTLNNSNVQNHQFKKLTGEEIFPVTGLKELCRKLPLNESELDSNFIFGVGAKLMQKYGKEFLPEIIKHVNLYKISKSENKYQQEVTKANNLNTSHLLSSKKKVSNPNNINSSGNFVNAFTTIKKNRESRINNNFTINNDNDGLDNSFCLLPIEKSENKNSVIGNNIAMFNSMGDSSSNVSNFRTEKKEEIVVNIGKNMISSDNKLALKSFIEDVEKLSNETKNKIKNKKDDLGNFFNQIEELTQMEEVVNVNNFAESINNFGNVNANQANKINNNANNIQDHSFDFDNFDFQGQYILDEEENEGDDEELKDFAAQAKALNEGNKKKRKRGENTDEEDEVDAQQGGRRKKGNGNANPKANWFKMKAIYNKINKNKQKKFL